MPCVIGCLALFMPRVALVLVWLSSDYLNRPYNNAWLWPLLGLIFMPLTTLAYAWAWHYGEGAMTFPGLIGVVLAVLIDLGLIGTSENSRRRSMRRDPTEMT
jgi:multisubunit Na+/H+ antiporter MnhB subunit